MAKVLHIVESFDGQATEKWLTILLRESLAEGCSVDWDFYCIQADAGKFEADVEKFGCQVICSPYPISQTLKFMQSLRQTISTGGYEIIHSHHDIMSGLYFLATLGFPVQKRIMHIHNTTLSLPTNSKFKQIFGNAFLRLLCYKFSDHIIGVSESALNSFLDGKIKNDKCSVVHCAIDSLKFYDVVKKGSELRVQLGVPDSALILLFVGRMNTYKNPAFVIDILEYLQSKDVEVYGIFVGEGSEKKEIADLADLKGISKRVKCLGWRNDIVDIMVASDLLVFPSLETPMEGLGLSVVEAQSVGLPVAMSLSVPDEAIVISELIVKISLNLGVEEWGNRIIDLIRKDRTISNEKCNELVMQSSYSPHNSLVNLVKLYQSPDQISDQIVDTLPNFIIIGSSKGGTTSLHAYLSTHPQIYLPVQKELAFFMEDEFKFGNWKRGVSWYSSQFSGTSDYLARGECSPSYAHEDQSKIAAKKMFDVLPSAKIIYSIRDPISRVRSHYFQEIMDGHISTSITLNDIVSAGLDGDRIENYYFKVIVLSSLYHQQLQRYLKYYPLSSFCIMIAEDFFEDTPGQVKKLFEFLGVYNSYVPPNISKTYNKAEGKRLRMLNPTALFRKLPGYSILSLLIPSSWRDYYRKVLSKEVDQKRLCSLTPENHKFLVELFRDDVLNLKILLGREFPGWYDYSKNE